MILCLCRSFNNKPLNEQSVQIHIQENPRLLGEQWDIVSFDMTDRAMVCGQCENAGNECLQRIARTENISVSMPA